MDGKCMVYTLEGRPCSLPVKFRVSNHVANYVACARHATIMAIPLAAGFGTVVVELLTTQKEVK